MRRTTLGRRLVLLALLVAVGAPALAGSVAHERGVAGREPGGRDVSVPADARAGDGKATRGGGAAAPATDPGTANNVKGGKHKKKGRHRSPTCFGLPATISDHRGDILGTDGDDVIIGDARPNRIFVNTGGNSGVDRVCAGGGDDRITKECCDGVLFAAGGPGDDDILGSEGSDALFGGDGDDRIDAGRSGVDTLIGDGGVDAFVTFGGDDTCQQNVGDATVSC